MSKKQGTRFTTADICLFVAAMIIAHQNLRPSKEMKRPDIKK
jgi:hypothetical protein